MICLCKFGSVTLSRKRRLTVTALRHGPQPRAARPSRSRAAAARARGPWSGPRPCARARRSAARGSAPVQRCGRLENGRFSGDHISGAFRVPWSWGEFLGLCQNRPRFRQYRVRIIHVRSAGTTHALAAGLEFLNHLADFGGNALDILPCGQRPLVSPGPASGRSRSGRPGSASARGGSGPRAGAAPGPGPGSPHSP